MECCTVILFFIDLSGCDLMTNEEVSRLSELIPDENVFHSNDVERIRYLEKKRYAVICSGLTNTRNEVGMNTKLYDLIS